MRRAILCTLLALAAPARAQNDECAGALPLVAGANGPFDNRTATESFPWPCGRGVGPDVWFRYRPTRSGEARVSTCSPATTFDTRLEAFAGDCTNLVPLGCNDDACPGFQSALTFPVQAHVDVWLRVGGYDGERGDFALFVTPPTAPPPNDDCTGSLPLALGRNGPFTNAGATSGAPGFLCSPSSGHDVWFHVVGPCDGVLRVRTCAPATTFDTTLAAWGGDCANPAFLACQESDFACTGQAEAAALDVPLRRGETVWVQVGSAGGAFGTFELDLECFAPPGNGSCHDALPLAEGRFGPFANVAVPPAAAPASCTAVGRPLWFRHDPPLDGLLRVSTCAPGTSIDTTLAVFAGGCDALVERACNDDACGGLRSELEVPVRAGERVWIQVGSYRGHSSGRFELELEYRAGRGGFTFEPTGCGGARLDPTGRAQIGAELKFAVRDAVGAVQLLWLGTESLNLALCPPCRLGTDVGLAFPLGEDVHVRVPPDPALVGGAFRIQGADVLGTRGGCVYGAALDFTLTDTVHTVIGS